MWQGQLKLMLESILKRAERLRKKMPQERDCDDLVWFTKAAIIATETETEEGHSVTGQMERGIHSLQ